MIEFLIAIFASFFIIFSIFIINLWGEDEYLWLEIFQNQLFGRKLYQLHLYITKQYNTFSKDFWK